MVSDGGVVTCEICAYFDEHGWIGPYRSHCRGLLPDGTRCCRTWTAPKQAHCRVCHQHFTTSSAFNAHLKNHEEGERVEHVDPGTLRSKDGSHRFVRRFDRFGEIWGWADQAHGHPLQDRRRPLRNAARGPQMPSGTPSRVGPSQTLLGRMP
jgi:hypothetical protein